VPKAVCACRFGRPCGPIARGAPRGMVAVDPSTV
jgi:hypothetical protein